MPVAAGFKERAERSDGVVEVEDGSVAQSPLGGGVASILQPRRSSLSPQNAYTLDLFSDAVVLVILLLKKNTD